MRSHAVEHDILMPYFVLLLCISLGLLLVWDFLALSPHRPHITFRTSFLTALVAGPKLLFSGEMFHSTLLRELVCIIRAGSALRDPGVIHVDVEFCLPFTVSLI